MYEKKTILFILIFCCCILFGCRTTMVSDKSERDRNYRDTQTELRNGQENIAVTSSEIKSTSEQIGETVNDITATSRELEDTVNATASDNNELGEILQRVRSREIPDNIAIELRKKYPDLFRE